MVSPLTQILPSFLHGLPSPHEYFGLSGTSCRTNLRSEFSHVKPVPWKRAFRSPHKIYRKKDRKASDPRRLCRNGARQVRPIHVIRSTGSTANVTVLSGISLESATKSRDYVDNVKSLVSPIMIPLEQDCPGIFAWLNAVDGNGSCLMFPACRPGLRAHRLVVLPPTSHPSSYILSNHDQ